MSLIKNLIKYNANHGIINFIKYIFWIIYSKSIHACKFNEDSKRWNTLKNKYKGERVFLIGNGPSLNKTPLHYLKDEYTICFNRFNVILDRINWNPYMYMVVDGLVASDMIDEIESMSKDSKITFLPDILPKYKLNFRKYFLKNEKIFWVYPATKKKYDLGMPYANLGGSVAIPAIQVLLHLGFDEIILIGVDMKYELHKNVVNITNEDIISRSNNDVNHFDPRYFGKNRKFHQPTEKVVNNIFSSFDQMASLAIDKGVSIVNATVTTKLESFKKVDFENLFSFSEEQKFNLIQEAIFKKNGIEIKSASELHSAQMFDHPEEVVNRDLFVIKCENIDKFINKFIYDYTPFGPFNGKIIFVKK